MKTDRRGDMGFMDAMVGFIAATIVLSAFLGVVIGVAAYGGDPSSALDPGRFSGTVEGGEFKPGYIGYMGDYLDSSGCRGISVSVLIPGGFCEQPEPTTIGSMDGELFSRTFVSMVRDDSGRIFPAVFEVVLCR